LPLNAVGIETDNTYDLGSPAFRWRNLYLGGEIIMANATKVLAKTSVTRSVWPAPAWTVMVFDVEQHDLVGDYDPITGVLTAIDDGYYEVHVGAAIISNIGGVARVAAFVNGVLAGQQDGGEYTGNLGMVASTIFCPLDIRVFLNIGDTLDIRTQTSLGGPGQMMVAGSFLNIIRRAVY